MTFAIPAKEMTTEVDLSARRSGLGVSCFGDARRGFESLKSKVDLSARRNGLVADRGVTEEEFDWEQVTGCVAAEGELPYYAEADINNNNSISFSVSPFVSLEELATRERAEGSGNLGWEVLLNTQTLEINFDVKNRELYIVGDNEDYIQTTKYEMLFEQFAEGRIREQQQQQLLLEIVFWFGLTLKLLEPLLEVVESGGKNIER